MPGKARLSRPHKCLVELASGEGGDAGVQLINLAKAGAHRFAQCLRLRLRDPRGIIAAIGFALLVDF